MEDEGSASISEDQLASIQESILQIYGLAMNCELDTWSGVAHIKVEAPDSQRANRVADGLAVRLAAHGVLQNIMISDNVVLARIAVKPTLN